MTDKAKKAKDGTSKQKVKKLTVEKLAVTVRAGLASEFLIVGCASINLCSTGKPQPAIAAVKGGTTASSGKGLKGK